MVDPTTIHPGSDFGPRYRIESLLGQGGMGRVYKGYDKELNRIVAIKVVRQGVMGESDALNRFKQELVLASKISHKNILRIHDLGEVDGMKFITMAYVDGHDLHQIIKDSAKLPLERVLKFATQLAGALAAAHAENVVHRDLKPQNILVDKNDQIYISDFGLAKSFAEGAVGMTQAGALLGTPRYMSPEQVEGKPTDGRSDIYAYGLILYEMATGDVPFTGDSALGVMYQRIKEKPKSPKLVNASLPDWLVRIIMRCLEKDPEARYQNAYEILADLQGSQSDSGLSHSKSHGGSTVQIRVPEFANRRWVWVVCGVVAVILLALAIPSLRHVIFGSGEKTGTSSDSGIPPLSSGRFVAILPLQVLGDSSQLGYVAKGIEEALSAKLFQLKDVRVTSDDAANQVDQKQPLPKIARALGANLLVQGVLQASADKIRITMHLEDVADNKRLWSREFNGVVGDLFTLEDQIYNQLVSGLNINPTNDEIAAAEARPTDNSTAYDLYLRGRNSMRGDNSKSMQAALDYFDQALRADPKFALAYTGIADASLRMNGIKKDSLWTQKALAAAQQAQQLNDKLPEVHATLGGVYRATGKYSEAVAELNRALSLAPNSDDFYRRLGTAYLDSGNTSQALVAFQKAIQLNPYFWVNQNALGVAYAHQGDYAKALEAFQQVQAIEPDIVAGYENIGNIYLQQGKYQESIPYFQKAIQIEPYFSTYSNLGTSYFFLKQYANAVEAFEKAAALNPNDTQTMVNLADAYRGAGQQDKAHTIYQQAISVGFKELQTNPQNADVKAEIALSYAKVGNASEAQNFIRQARAIDKTNVSYIYYEAEIDALLGRSTDALKLLREALEKHFPAEFAAGDEDLKNLSGNPEFTSLIKQYSEKKP
ncbi:MAG TPA: tetratricopeptide repeat protein [Candidatus Acidoferrum sp.]|jgi:eukaryotic-like serine/threonine-protein kinase|nr:tetratricopeptide repeat protein [Candidatus Acidoferrum sp.]